MKKSIGFAFLAVFAALIFACASLQAAKSAMLTDLNVIKNILEIRYAPADWKREYEAWDFEEQIEAAKKKIAASTKVSVEVYQNAVKSVLNSANDSSLFATFVSTEAALLPIGVQGAEGRYFITWIAKDPNSGKPLLDIPLELGDELLLFDGLSTAKVVADLKAKQFGEIKGERPQALAAQGLTMRLGLLGMKDIPKGKAVITVKHKKNGQIADYSLQWVYKPEKILNRSQGSAQGKAASNPFKYPFVPKSHMNPIHKEMKKVFASLLSAREDEGIYDESAEDDQYDYGYLESHNGYLPELGAIIWKSEEDSLFKAYTFKAENGDAIGYIRIPHFDYSDSEANAMADDFGLIMSQMEKETKALILDVTMNPGGDTFYMYAILSMLTEKPLELPRQRCKIDQKMVFNALKSLEFFESLLAILDSSGSASGKSIDNEVINGYHVGLNWIKKVLDPARFIIQEWNCKKTFTNPYYPVGIEEIIPHPKHRYTKPIIALADVWNSSLAEVFLAALQDNSRALIVGSETAGMIGELAFESHPNLFGIASIICPTTILERKGKPLENMAVRPDLPHQMTADDLNSGYPDFIKTIQKALSLCLSK